MIFAVHQPNYAPWCGYFAKLAHADVFVILDDVQMPQGRSYVSRTKVRKGQGVGWLTVPVARGSRGAINQVAFADPGWAAEHAKRLRQDYARAPAFEEAWGRLEPVYARGDALLWSWNVALITAVRDYLGLETPLVLSSEFGIDARGDERIAEIGRRLGASAYLSGAGGANYQSNETYEQAGIELQVREYAPIAYPQQHDPFEPGLSILDALFHVGADARRLLSYEPATTDDPRQRQ